MSYVRICDGCSGRLPAKGENTQRTYYWRLTIESKNSSGKDTKGGVKHFCPSCMDEKYKSLMVGVA